jgi:TonB-linked SusC/RagA family outer membrane protein
MRSFPVSGSALARAVSSLSITLLATVGGLAISATDAIAQGGTIAGTVVTNTGLPIADAQVRIAEANRSVLTDANGRFRISGVPGNTVTIEARRIGFRSVQEVVTVGMTNLRLTLPEQVVALDRIVVTGTAGGQSKRELGTAVTSINAAEETQKTAIPNIQQLLNARAPGVFINSATGNVGAGARIRIRGASSMSLLNEPLIYVDGVRVNNTPASGPANQAFGSSSISRINDINPDDIESIEVIRGPAAATLYGTEASNGVIQIITKRGSSGRPRWSLNLKSGINYLQDPEGRWPVNYQTIPKPSVSASARDTVSIDIIDLEDARGTPVFKKGTVREYDLSANGGTDLFRYFTSVGLEDTDGIEPTSWVKRYTGRANLSIVPNSKIAIAAHMGYVNGTTHLPPEAGFGGHTWTTISANPANYWIVDPKNPTQLIISPRRGFHSGLPEQYDSEYQIWQDLERFTGSLQISQTLSSWLRHRLALGTDRTIEGDNYFFPRTEDSLTKVIFGSDALGYRDITQRHVNYYTLDYSASGVFDPTATLKATTSVGAQYYRNETSFLQSFGSIFPTVGLSALTSTTSGKTTSGDVTEDATLGFFVQEQLGWRDRLFATAAVRADDNSAFGQNFDRVYYPKYSLAWVISDEPFWRWPAIEALKLRAAYGESGKQPITYSALQTYAAATGPNDVATVTPQFIGNADLGPERSKEFEFGFDLGAFRDRLGAEFTWYRKRTVDAILDRQIAPSIGIPNTQPFNAGLIKNWGSEILVRGKPIATPSFDWEVSVNWATNDSRIESLGTPEAVLALRRASGTPDFVVAGSFLRHQVGYPIGSYFEQRVVSAQLLANGTADLSTVMCMDGKGGTMLCTGPDLRYGTADDAPDVYIGRSLPKGEGGLSSTLSLWNKVRLYAMLDRKSDYRKVDGNTRVRCQIFIRCRENFYPLEFDPKRIAAIQSNGTLVDYYINDASFTRLREVSISYILPPMNNQIARFTRGTLTLSGRNLHLWTNYPGLDPEAFFLGGSRGGNFGQFDQTTNPQIAQWVLSLSLDW